MMKKLIVCLMIFVLSLGLLYTNATDVSAKTSYVYEYTDKIAVKDGILYLKSFDNGNTSLCKFSAATGKTTVIVSEKNGIVHFLINQSTIYYTTLTQKENYVIYSISINGKNKKKVATGMIEYVDSTYLVYSQCDGTLKNLIYKKNLKTGEVAKIVQCNGYLDYIKKIGDTLYFYKYEPNTLKVKLLSMDIRAKKMSLITTDKAKEEESFYTTSISDVICQNGSLFYQYGTYQGTGHYWYGTLKKINAQGKKATVASNVVDERIFHDNTNIYYQKDMELSYVSYHTKTGKKTSFKMTVTEDQFIDIIDSKTYRIDWGKQGSISVDRFASGTNMKKLQKNFIKFSYKKNKTYSYSGTTKKLGNYYVVAIHATDFNDMNYGWRGKDMGTKWFVANQSGKVLGSF